MTFSIRLAGTAVLIMSALVQSVCALPTVHTIEVKRPVLNDFEFDIDFALSWGAGDLPGPGTDAASIFCRVWKEDTIISTGEFALFEAPEDEAEPVLVTEGSCGPAKVDKTGMITLVVEVSFNADFAEVSSGDVRIRSIPGGVTILPPVVAVVMAIATRDVLPSLFCGVWTAAFFIHAYDPFRGFLRTLDTYVVESFTDSGHVMVILFSWFLSGLMGLIQRGGGAQGLADLIVKYAKTRRSTMLVCFICGLVIFFDDYANTLIVGSTFRPIMDAMYISREKLAFLVDATSAPIASISPISSWVGYELSLIEDAYDSLIDSGADLSGWETSPFLVFVRTIPGRFYPIAMLFLQLMLILTQRDFGPMFSAERRAHREKKVTADDANHEEVAENDALKQKPGVPARWWNAVLPVASLIFLVLLAMILTGKEKVEELGIEKSIEDIFGNSDSFSSLLWSTFFVSICTWVLFRLQFHNKGAVEPFWKRSEGSEPFLKLRESEDTWVEGIKQLVATTLVLILAWAIGDSMKALGSDVYIASGVSENIDKEAIPVLVFILSAFISMCTGTSWGTMAIMFPVATRSVFESAPGDEDLMLSTIASILSGSVFGDHVTPISDTTILSSLSSRCDLMHHVKTQAPYAVLVGLVSIVTGDLMSGYVYPMWAGLLVTIFAALVVGYFLSAHVDSEDDGVDPINTVWNAAAASLGRVRRKGKTEPETDLAPGKDQSDVEKLTAPVSQPVSQPASKPAE